MKLQSLILAGALALGGTVAPLAFTGCATTQAAARYHTLKDVQIAVDRAMRTYGELCVKGKVSAATQAQVDAAYEQYRITFRDAVAAARLDYRTVTPDNVAALAAVVVNLIAHL